MIVQCMPYPAPSGVSAAIAVQEFGTGTTAALIDYTTAALVGATPDAMLFIAAPHDPANDPGETATGEMMFGAMTASSGSYTTFRSVDNVASTNTESNSITSGSVFYHFGSSVNLKTSFGVGSPHTELMADGVRISWAVNNSPDTRAVFAGFVGLANVARGGINGGTGTSALTTTLGWEPDLVIFYGEWGAGTGSFVAANTGTHSQFGLLVNDGTQRCISLAETHNTSAGRPFAVIRNDSSLCAISRTDGTMVSNLVGAITGTGFTLTPSASYSSKALSYMAMAFGGARTKLVDFTTPTSTGSQTINGAGFTPSFALVVLSNLETINDHPGSTDDRQCGYGISFVGNEQWGVSIRLDAGADPTDTACQVASAAIIGPSATDCDAIKASLTTFTSDGMTVNYSAVQGTGKIGFVLFVE